MKRALFFVSIFSLILTACESKRGNDYQEEQERSPAEEREQITAPVPEPEHGGGAGNR